MTLAVFNPSLFYSMEDNYVPLPKIFSAPGKHGT